MTTETQKNKETPLTEAQPRVERVVRVPWPKERAPLKIKARCPICGAGLLLNAGEACEMDDNGEWIASEIDLDCESEPGIDSPEWDNWFQWHYSQPYIDWLPLEMKILKAVQRKYYFAL